MNCVEFIARTDIHGKFNYLRKLENIRKNVELLIIAGDITHFGKIDDVIVFLDRAIEVFKTVLFIPGNCDPYETLNLNTVKERAINIHGKLFKYKDYYFYGLGGSNITPFNTLIEFDDRYLKRMINKLDELTNNYDRTIVVTHAPPYATLDKTFIGLRVGVRPYLEFLKKRYPIVWISGHVHEARGQIKLGRTLVINPGAFMRKYYSVIRLCNDNIYVDLGKL